MDNTQTEKNLNIITRDKFFLLIDNKENRRFVVTNMKKQKLGKKEINVTFFEGKKLNTFWDVEEKEYKEISHKEFFEENILEDEEIDYENEKITKSTNKEIYSEEISQKLSSEEIKELKGQGFTGDECIKIILENNSSMAKRSIFSQSKIIRKKGRIYKHRVWLAPINLFNVVETFFMFDIKRINWLRFDSISTMLVHSNFINDAKTLIYEDTENILTSAYANRCSTKANVVTLYNPRINNKNLCIFNLREKEKNAITYLDIDFLTNKSSFYHPLFLRQYINTFQNLVICLKNETNLIITILQLIPYLKYSGTLIVFTKEIDILLELEKTLVENKVMLDIRIHETIAREYQVLPLRTHPMMNNRGFSGYVLTAIKIYKS